MRESAYNYFKNLYKNFDEPIICADDKMRVVYATNCVYTAFDVSENALLHINCIFPNRYLYKVYDAACVPECISFDFISITEDKPRHCVMTPVMFENIYYFVFWFGHTTADALDRLQKRDIKMALDVVKSELAKETTAIISHTDKQDDTIVENVIRIRKLFFDINALATDSLSPATVQVIELNEYIKRIVTIITNQLGKDRIEFKLNLCNRVLISELTYDALDVIICNTVANSVRNARKKATITIGTMSGSEQNVIVISDTDAGFRRMQLYIDRNKDDVRYALNSPDDLSLAVIEKIVRDFGGSIRISENSDGGITTGIMLPKSPPRADIMRTPEDHDVLSDNSIVRMMLSGL